MKNKMLITIFFLFLISFIGAKERDIYKIVRFKKSENFKESENIEGLTASKNYVGVRVNSISPRRNSAILFSKKGEKIFEIEHSVIYRFIKAEPVEELNYFIVINNGSRKVPDLIRAFDIKTGEEVWRAHSNTILYEISPNKMYMITKGDPGTERTGIFEIINLKDGSKVDFGYKFSKYRATWLDDERIVLVFQDWERSKNSNFIKSKELILMEKEDKLHSELLSIKHGLEVGKISKSYYEKRKKELDRELKKIHDEKRSPGEMIGYPGNHSSPTPKAVKLVIYNMRTENIEREKYLYSDDGSKITIGVSPDYANTVNVDKNKNIYIHGERTLEDTYLAKFSENLDFIWKTTEMDIANLVKFTVDDDIYFRFKTKGKLYLIDNDTGEIVPVIEAKKSNKKIKDIDFSVRYRIPIVNIINNVNVNNKNKVIEFYKEEE